MGTGKIRGGCGGAKGGAEVRDIAWARRDVEKPEPSLNSLEQILTSTSVIERIISTSNDSLLVSCLWAHFTLFKVDLQETQISETHCVKRNSFVGFVFKALLEHDEKKTE